MQVRVKTLTGWSSVIAVFETDTVDVVRQKVSQILPGTITVGQIQLIFQEKVIEVGQMKDLGVHNGAELMVVISERQQMEVTISHGQARITLQVEPDETVENLKMILCEKVGVSVDEQSLRFQQKEMTSGQLKHYQVCHGSVLQLAVRSIQVFVVDFGGKTHTIDVHTSDMVEQLKDKVYERTRVPQSQQRLVSGTKQLQNGNTLNYYGIKHQSTIQLTGRVRGG